MFILLNDIQRRRSKTTSGDCATLSERHILCTSTHEERLWNEVLQRDLEMTVGYTYTIWEAQQARQKLKSAHCFYSVECQYKGWYTMTHRYNYSPFIWVRIMKVKAGSRGETNNYMDYDYSNRSCGTHRCHCGATRFLNDPVWATFFALFQR